MEVSKMKADRQKFLLKAYEYTNNGQSNMWVDGYEMGKELGFDKDYATNIYYYLKNEGLIKPMGAGIRLTLTHEGVKEIELALCEPEWATEHFPPINQYNTINIKTMSGGAVQLATNNSPINYGVSSDVLNDLKKVVEQLQKEISSLNLTDDTKNEIEAELLTLVQQSNSPKPKKEILKIALSSVKTIIESTIAGVAANAISPSLQGMSSTLNHLLHNI